MKIEVKVSCEVTLHIYHTTRRYIPEDSNIQQDTFPNRVAWWQGSKLFTCTTKTLCLSVHTFHLP